MYKRISMLREEKNLTQKQVAEFLNCDQLLYSKYEKGVREIPLKIMVKLARLYEVSIDFIVEETDERKRYPSGKRPIK